MSSDRAALALMFDAPMQSWGATSRFEHLTTELHPTKSGVIGLLCAALGLAKGSPKEHELLPELARLRMTSITIPRQAGPIHRFEDYHTVLDTRRTDKTINPDSVITRREYLAEARFGVILEGDRSLLQQTTTAIKNPQWGIWFGRKSCIPAEPIYRGLFHTFIEAQQQLIGDTPIETFTVVSDVAHFDDGTHSLADYPRQFGDGNSSGLDARQFTVRRIKVQHPSKVPDQW